MKLKGAISYLEKRCEFYGKATIDEVVALIESVGMGASQTEKKAVKVYKEEMCNG